MSCWWLFHCWKYYESLDFREPLLRKCVRCGQREKNFGTVNWPDWKRVDWGDEESIQGQEEARFLRGHE